MFKPGTRGKQALWLEFALDSLRLGRTVSGVNARCSYCDRLDGRVESKTSIKKASRLPLCGRRDK